MNKRFTVEESNLISIFMEEGIDSDVGGRKNVINGINKTLKHLEDDEMVELSLCVLAKKFTPFRYKYYTRNIYQSSSYSKRQNTATKSHVLPYV